MNLTDSNSNLVFYYEIEKIYKRVVNRSLQRVRGLKDPSGRPLFDTLAMTDSERNTFDHSIAPKSAVKVFRFLQPFTKDVVSAYQYNAADPDDSTGGSGYIIYTIDPPTNYDPNSTDPLDTTIESALVSAMLREWFTISGAPEFAFECVTECDDLTSEINSLLQRRTAATIRPYNVIG